MRPALHRVTKINMQLHFGQLVPHHLDHYVLHTRNMQVTYKQKLQRTIQSINFWVSSLSSYVITFCKFFTLWNYTFVSLICAHSESVVFFFESSQYLEEIHKDNMERFVNQRGLCTHDNLERFLYSM